MTAKPQLNCDNDREISSSANLLRQIKLPKIKWWTPPIGETTTAYPQEEETKQGCQT